MALLVINGDGAPREPFRSDVELTGRASAGDVDAQRALVVRLMNRARATTRYLAAGHPDAEDYAQLAMIEVLQSAGSYRGDSSLESWAEKITVRTAMRQLKRRKWRAQYMVFGTEYGGREEAPGVEGVARKRVLERVSALLADLKPEFRAVMTLKLVYGHSIAEIAEMVETNEHNVRYRIRIGRKRLRKRVVNDPVLREWIGEEEK